MPEIEILWASKCGKFSSGLDGGQREIPWHPGAGIQQVQPITPPQSLNLSSRQFKPHNSRRGILVHCIGAQEKRAFQSLQRPCALDCARDSLCVSWSSSRELASAVALGQVPRSRGKQYTYERCQISLSVSSLLSWRHIVALGSQQGCRCHVAVACVVVTASSSAIWRQVLASFASVSL